MRSLVRQKSQTFVNVIMEASENNKKLRMTREHKDTKCPCNIAASFIFSESSPLPLIEQLVVVQQLQRGRRRRAPKSRLKYALDTSHLICQRL